LSNDGKRERTPLMLKVASVMVLMRPLLVLHDVGVIVARSSVHGR
jgi:hypothetical protein